MDSISTTLMVLVVILSISTVGIAIFALKKSNQQSSDNGFPEELSKVISEKINSSFGESIKTLTDLANEKLGSVREATNEDLENKKKLIDLRIEGISKTLDEVQKTLKKYDTDSTTRLTQLTSDIKNISTQT